MTDDIDNDGTTLHESGRVVQPTDARMVTLNAQQQALLHRMLDWHAAVVRFGAESPSAFKHFAACAALAVPQAPLQAEPASWWQKRADEIEVQVARSGSQDAMVCYTQMRGLLQAVTTPQAEPAVAEQASVVSSEQGMREALAALLSFVRREAPHLSGKVLGYADAALATPRPAQTLSDPLTDEQCDEFRRLPVSFNDMVRAIYESGKQAARVAPSQSILPAESTRQGLSDAFAGMDIGQKWTKEHSITYLQNAANIINAARVTLAANPTAQSQLARDMIADMNGEIEG